MHQRLFSLSLLGILAAAPARADEPAPPIETSPAPASESLGTDATDTAEAAPPASSIEATGEETAATPSQGEAAPRTPVPPPAFPTTPYATQEGRYPPPMRYAVEPRAPRQYGDAGATLAIGIGGNYRFRDDTGYRRIGASERQTELDVFVSYDVWQPLPPLVIATGVNYRFGTQGSDAALTTHTMLADATARYTLASWLFPHLRVAAGVQTAHFELAEGEGGVALSDKRASPAGSIGGGFTLRTPPRLFETHDGRFSSLSLGVLVEAGYLFAKAASFEATPESDSEVPQESIALGRLEQRSPYLRLLGVVRF